MAKQYKLLKVTRCIGLLFFILSLTLSLGAANQSGESDSVLAIKAGVIMPVTGKPIINGVIIIHNGRIDAVGNNIKIPADAKIMTPPIRW